ncbi:MAG: tRNA lysidine(34) synthetase TilS [Bacteroidales bacterium]|nr:tRNA lysidine(34) synthetase TilS [Bacteroidales bacterium]
MPEKSKILLAVSGGADSVAMLKLFENSKFTIGIAHCNFHLRGEESDLDEKYVKELSETYETEYFRIDFDTKKYSKEKGISIEMAARELRYTWFEKIREENNYDFIATAHHKDDIIETFFINLARGTGIRGLTGINAVNDKIIRPLLFADREEIIEYLKKDGIKFRTDSSNSDVKIMRNKFRHEILPAFREVNTAFSNKILETISYLKQTETVLNQEVSNVIDDVLKTHNQIIFIDIKKLQKYSPTKLFLYEILKTYSFNNKQVDDIYETLDKNAGKQFFSETHKLIKDRENLIIEKINTVSENEIIINKDDELIQISDNQYIKINIFNKNANYKIKKSKKTATFDFNKIKYPLTIRNWQKGDYFYPFGMNKKKKLSNFFIDEKISIIEKEKIKILVSEEKIAWIIGYRTDNRFKITEKTKKIIEFDLIKSS